MSLPLRCICGYQSQIDRLKKERNRWRAVAEVLALELGRVEIASAEWENQEGANND
jgi:hypothetical protein